MPHHPAHEHLLRALLESTEEAVVSVSLEGVIGAWSGSAERLYGYTSKEMVGNSLSRLIPPRELPQMEHLHSANGPGENKSIDVGERLHKNGSRILLAIRRSIIRNDNGEAEGILEMAQAFDLHEALPPSGEASLQLMMGQVPGLLWSTDRNLRILGQWGEGLPALKIGSGSLVGQDVRKFLGAMDPHTTPIAEHYAALQGIASRFEYSWKDNTLEVRLGPLRSETGEILGCLGAALDFTDQKKTEEEVLYQARHDALTGLANYREFTERLDQEVSRGERSRRPFTLLLMDLDSFKRINDLQGHLVGNRALRRLADVLNEHCRSTDLAARYGGDEFAVLLIDSDSGMAENIAQRIERRLRSDSEKPTLSVSIGIGVYPDDGRTAAEILEAADRRLYRCKKNPSVRTFSAF